MSVCVTCATELFKRLLRLMDNQWGIKTHHSVPLSAQDKNSDIFSVFDLFFVAHLKKVRSRKLNAPPLPRL